MLLLLSTDNILAALFGYVIGTKLSISSLKVGQQISIWMHRYMNPHLANAEDLQYSSQHSPINQRVLQDLYQKNRVLPDFERRYLDGLLSKQEIQWVKQRVNALDALDQWKQTTQDHRVQPYLLAQGSYSSSASRRSINTSSTPTIHPSPSYLMENKLLTMQEIERKIIVERQDPSENVLRVAREHGWDVDALKTWADQVIAVSNEEAAVMELQKQKDPTPSRSAHKKNHDIPRRACTHCYRPLAILCLLICIKRHYYRCNLLSNCTLIHSHSTVWYLTPLVVIQIEWWDEALELVPLRYIFSQYWW